MTEWEIKHFNPKNGKRYTRLKATFGATSILVFVGSEGWVYKNEFQTKKDADDYKWFGEVVADKQVRISMNGPLALKWTDWREIIGKIDEMYTINVALRNK